MDISSLNSAQQEAVRSTEGAVMVLAGAGSGKTRMLVKRIGHMIDQQIASTYEILALTFSNKAAREMRERIGQEITLELDLGALQVTTFHSFCARLLRTEANYLGLSRNFTIYGSSESKAVVKSLMGRRGVSSKQISPYEILAYIDDLKNRGYYLEREGGVASEIDLSEDFYGYFREYESELARANALDFGGLITGVLRLFQKFPKVLQCYQDRFKYILIDEYQDTNRAQFELMKWLTGDQGNVCVVGDEDQSIYSWRGADIRNILDFEQSFPEAKTIKLEQNYRSSRNIIEAASCVIARNEQRKGKQMWTDNQPGESLQIVESRDERGEAEFIAAETGRLVSSGVSYNDIAVFYRTNSQSRILEDCLRQRRTPYRVVGGIEFYQRKEIKDLLAYLRLIVNSKDSLALARIINVPARGVGTTTLRKLEQEAVGCSLSLWEILEAVVAAPERFTHIRLTAKVKTGLSALVTLLSEVMVLNSEQALPSEMYQKVLYESSYWNILQASNDHESQARLENLEELLSGIKQYEQGVEKPSLSGYLETITLDESYAMEEVPQNGEVSLMTVHGAKGLEFPYVFLVGAEENLFPSFRSMEDGERGIEEERRLFYVAMTRAMKKLYISFALGRMVFGQVRFNGPCRFINEMPKKYFQWIKNHRGPSSRDQGGQQKDNIWDDHNFNQEQSYGSPSPAKERVSNVVIRKKTGTHSLAGGQYPKGTKVVHSLYGEGTVLHSSGVGNNEKVMIQFHNGMRKRFLAKFAPLSIRS